MIVGLGVELIDVVRFGAALDRFGERLRQRVFSEHERAFAQGRRVDVQSLAVRFAAKLAARRALGRPGIAFRDVEVVRHGEDAPTLALHGEAARVARELGVTRTSVSLTHDPTWCVSHVVLEAGP
ncbi:MAG: holo-ACP synthase [Deltaproteobacteria bacterium]|jgi:holo-[acyl-carrier protein] synthase|nr:holo-ACP synthase [Deltaproteobacteria bacterium]